MAKRDWVMNSTIAVMLSTSLLMGGQVGHAASSSESSVKAEIVKHAKDQVGDNYVYGATGRNEFDAVGLVKYVFSKEDIELSRSITTLYKTGKKVDLDDLQPGDVVFFKDSSSNPSYAGIYIGSNQFVYASVSQRKVITKSLSDLKHSSLVGARRYIGTVAEKPTEKPPVSNTNNLADKVINNGEDYLKTPYKFGSSKSTTKTFDCSSFTQRVFKEAGISLPRDSRQQSGEGKSVSLKNVQKGDLIFMRSSGSSSDRITHVAIYAGNGKILHTYGRPGVTYSKFWDTNWEKRVVKVRRVLP